LEDYIAFDEDMRYAGFTRPILQYIGDRDYFLYLDKGFILSSKNNAIGANVIFFKDDYSFELNNLKKLKKNYESKTNIFLQNTDRSGQNIDNCGNIIYDINKRLEDLKPYA
jgi:hypothetical protein